MRVLIIEDNPDIVANLYEFLEPLGYILDCAGNGRSGLELASRGDYEAIVLDVMLPGMDGLALCRQLRREARKATPVLMLTARDSLEDKLSGFDSGADDYLVKPFMMRELDARLRALVRRSRDEGADPVLRFGPLSFDTATMTVTRENRQIDLTPTGYKLLERLMHEASDVVSHADLEYEVWGDAPPDSGALRTHIHALRQALDRPFSVPMLRTRQGLGYQLIDPSMPDGKGNGGSKGKHSDDAAA